MTMANPQHENSPKGSSHKYRKLFQKKREDKKISQVQVSKLSNSKEKKKTTENEISEETLRRLHTLGSQKFGSSPFSQHFYRWITSIKAVLDDFESHPKIDVDEQFHQECKKIQDNIRMQLEQRKQTEDALDREISNLLAYKQQLTQINRQYAGLSKKIKSQKNSTTKQLNKKINELTKEQDEIVRMKTGFFRPVSKKGREKLEIQVTQQLSDKQRELELVTLEYNSKLTMLKENFEEKREPILEQIKFFRKKIQSMEIDDSLEERWFACEALSDAVNNFLQRKTINPSNPHAKWQV